MRYTWAAVVVLCLVASGVWAQGGISSARSLGMGGAVVGVADDAAAWFQNPAGLAALHVPVQPEKVWGVDVLGVYMDSKYGDNSTSSWGVLGSGWDPAKRMGFGAGYGDVQDDFSVLGAGFGMGIGASEWSWGVNVAHYSYDSYYAPVQVSTMDDNQTFVNLGLLYQVRRPEGDPVRLGLVAEDVLDDSNNGPYFHIGVGWPATPELLVAADVRDVTGQTDDGPYFSAGVEYKPMRLMNWAFRAGLYDTGNGTDLTVGAGYAWERWRLDAAYGDISDGVWSIGAATCF